MCVQLEMFQVMCVLVICVQPEMFQVMCIQMEMYQLMCIQLMCVQLEMYQVMCVQMEMYQVMCVQVMCIQEQAGKVSECCKRVCAESWLKKKNPLLHQGFEPAPVVCQIQCSPAPTPLTPHFLNPLV